MSVVLHSARLVQGGREVQDAWVRFEDGRVVASGTGRSWDVAAVVVDTVVVDAAELAGHGAVLAPGFVDIHGHGGDGAAYDDGPDAILTARALHRAHGTTRAVVSLVTAPLELLRDRVAMVADLEPDAGVVGSHLEGPFLDPGHHGAHDPALLRMPEPDSVRMLLVAGRGTVRQITLAPELAGGMAAIRAVTAAGAVAAVGHTNADFGQARAAFEAGAGILTHAFNAMRGLHHREPGPVAAALADSRVTLEVIADDVHLHPAIVRLAFAGAPGRIALVTDAMAAAGAGDGRYVLGALDVAVSGGVARVAGLESGLDGGAIAGSTLTQDAALRRAVAAGVPLAAVVEALTATPARAIGMSGRFGALLPGRTADAVLLSSDLRVRQVWVDGAAVAGAAADAAGADGAAPRAGAAGAAGAAAPA